MGIGSILKSFVTGHVGESAANASKDELTRVAAEHLPTFATDAVKLESRSIGSLGASKVESTLAGMTTEQASKEISRILASDTALEVAIAANKTGLKTTAVDALKHGMSVAETLESRETMALASETMGHPDVAHRWRQGLDKLLVSPEHEARAAAFTQKLKQMKDPVEMLKLLRTTEGALPAKESLGTEVKNIVTSSASSDMSLFGLIVAPSAIQESIWKRGGIFNQLSK